MDELVPRESWGDFCERFTQQHRGWLVTLECYAAPEDAVGAAVKSTPSDLAEFRALEISEGGQELRISVAAESRPEQWAMVRRPVRMFFEMTADRSHRGLRLDGRDGETVVLRFRTPARPEELDGSAAFGGAD